MPKKKKISGLDTLIDMTNTLAPELPLGTGFIVIPITHGLKSIIVSKNEKKIELENLIEEKKILHKAFDDYISIKYKNINEEERKLYISKSNEVISYLSKDYDDITKKDEAEEDIKNCIEKIKEDLDSLDATIVKDIVSYFNELFMYARSSQIDKDIYVVNVFDEIKKDVDAIKKDYELTKKRVDKLGQEKEIEDFASQLQEIIPDSLKQIVESDSFTKNLINSIILGDLEKILFSNPSFFPEYKSLGVKKIENCLSKIEELIPIEFRSGGEKTIGAIEVAVIIISALFQYVAYYISEEAFIKLVHNDFKDKWTVFIQKFRKQSYSNIQMIIEDDAFSYDILEKLTNISSDILNENRYINIKIIRLFIQKNQYEIATQILLKDSSWKGENSKVRKIKEIISIIFENYSKDFHDESIIDCIDNFQTPEGRGILYRCRILYPLVLLRISNIINIGIESVLKEGDDYQFCLEQKRFTIIKKVLTSSTEYENVVLWKNEIQEEIDKGNSILCLYYYQNYSLLLSVLYVELKESKKLIEDKDFSLLPARIKTDSSIIPLLVGPLYNNNIWAGVRELLQNAIDSCRKRKLLDPGITSIIEIKFNSKDGILTVSDNGIGMDEDAIRNYFLSVGTSFYNSGEWISKYKDDKGEDLIPHIGCYGIGVLSYFMLAKEYNVLTCFNDNGDGWKFDIKYDDIIFGKGIELKEEKALKEKGTTVTLAVNNFDCRKELKNQYGWMKLLDIAEEDISIILTIDHFGPISLNSMQSSKNWITIKNEDGYNIQVTYNYSENSSVNGVVVPIEGVLKHFRVMSFKDTMLVNISRTDFTPFVYEEYRKFLKEASKVIVYNLFEFKNYELFFDLFYSESNIGISQLDTDFNIRLVLVDLIDSAKLIKDEYITNISNYEDLHSFICDYIQHLKERGTINEGNLKFFEQGNYSISFETCNKPVKIGGEMVDDIIEVEIFEYDEKKKQIIMKINDYDPTSVRRIKMPFESKRDLRFKFIKIFDLLFLVVKSRKLDALQDSIISRKRQKEKSIRLFPYFDKDFNINLFNEIKKVDSSYTDQIIRDYREYYHID